MAVPVAVDGDEVRATVLALVADKTGYPLDMLDVDLDLEADLGVDTVKQAELFATIREHFGVKRDDRTLKLRDFPTLAHVISVHDRTRRAASARRQRRRRARRPRHRSASLDAADVYPRRVPVPVPRPPIDACVRPASSWAKEAGSSSCPTAGESPTSSSRGSTSAASTTFVVDGAPPADDTSALQTCSPVGRCTASTGSRRSTRRAPSTRWTSRRGAKRCASASSSCTRRVRACLGDDQAPFLVAGTRLGGLHGYDDDGAVAPLGGAVTGFAKAYAREQPTALVKAVDFAADAAPGAIAAQLVAETLSDPGAVEIGHRDGQRWTVGLHEQPAPMPGRGRRAREGLRIRRHRCRGRHRVGDRRRSRRGVRWRRSTSSTSPPRPMPTTPTSAASPTTATASSRMSSSACEPRASVRRRSWSKRSWRASNGCTPRSQAIDAVRGAGGEAYYHSVDLTDAARGDRGRRRHPATARPHRRARARGRVEVSRFLRDKQPREFDLVFDVKSDGWFNLLHAIGDMPLGATVVFSSVAGRFGNGGQTDYSAANDLLCKVSSQLPAHPPVDAWYRDRLDGVGRDRHGDTWLHSQDDGARGDRHAASRGRHPDRAARVARGDTPGEIVVGQRFGVLVAEVIRPAGSRSEAAGITNVGPMVGRVVSTRRVEPARVETTLDPPSNRSCTTTRSTALRCCPV